MKNLKGGEMMRRRLWMLFVLLMTFSFFISGCFYFTAVSEMKNAESRVSELKAANGAKSVPYEYTSAEKFLERSKAEFADNDYKAAKEFAVRSKVAAEAGLSKVKK